MNEKITIFGKIFVFWGIIFGILIMAVNEIPSYAGIIGFMLGFIYALGIFYGDIKKAQGYRRLEAEARKIREDGVDMSE